MMTNRISYFLLLLVISLPAFAQNFLGTQGFSYGGVFSMQTQPAAVADSRMIFDVGLGGTSTTMSNNYLSIKGTKLGVGGSNPNGSNWLTSQYQRNMKNDKKYYGYLNNDTYLPFSFMITTSKKAGIGFQTRIRSFAMLDKVDGNFINAIASKNLNPYYYGKEIDMAQARLAGATYMDYTFTYGRVLMDEGEHFLKMGFSGKVLQAFSGQYMYAKDLKLTYTSDTTMNISSADIRFANGTNIDPVPRFSNFLNKDSGLVELKRFYKATFPTGIGMDLGVVYEWRPNIQDYEYVVNGKTGRIRYDNKYKLRVGASLLDLGYINIKRKASAGTITGINNNNLPANFNNANSSTALNDFFDATNFNSTVKDSVKFRMALPTALTFQADYRINKRFYVSALYYKSFKAYNSVKALHGLSSLTITPRWEQMYLTTAVPITIDQNGGLNVGFAMSSSVVPIPKIEKYFPVHIIAGMSNSLSSVVTPKIRGTDVYIGMHFMIPYRNNDIDFDGTVNRKDKCLEVPGLKEFKGCPDTDGDKIPDKDDDCPLVFGLKEFKGCPDTDKDKVPDFKDDCPLVRGSVKLNGCPDKDGDQVADKDDDCPDVRGKKEFKGCPDTDNDGVADHKDKCPKEKGSILAQGCPDDDEDGIENKDDKCPKLKGKKTAKGCPDTDDDEIADTDDKCPTIAGKTNTKGCPDTDEDGVADDEDTCPDLAGKQNTKGCPDIDNDGTPDIEDDCPELAGDKNGKGCPKEQVAVTDPKTSITDPKNSAVTDPKNPSIVIPPVYPPKPNDKDGDGILDKDDKCPDIAGGFGSAGCPSGEVPEFIRKAFETIEFDVAKSDIKPEYFDELDGLAFYLKINPSINLYLKGNTDSDGSDESNEALSVHRAESVKKYLVEHGVPTNRLKTQGFGETRPKASNDTPEDKQKNRRVEVEIWK